MPLALAGYPDSGHNVKDTDFNSKDAGGVGDSNDRGGLLQQPGDGGDQRQGAHEEGIGRVQAKYYFYFYVKMVQKSSFSQSGPDRTGPLGRDWTGPDVRPCTQLINLFLHLGQIQLRGPGLFALRPAGH